MKQTYVSIAIAGLVGLVTGQNLPVPPLPGYDYNALEPFIDEATMRVHHLGHHATYAAQLNTALEKMRWDPQLKHLAKMGIDELLHHLDDVPDEFEHVIRTAGGGYVNHDLFWKCMSPWGGDIPKDDSSTIQERRLATAIDKVFGSFEDMQKGFSAAATRLFGSGWTFLYWDKQLQSLEITNMQGHDTPAFDPLKVPLLALDMWEHAYYLKHQNRRAEYIAAFWRVTDWKSVATRFVAATGEVVPDPIPSMSEQERQRVGIVSVDGSTEVMVE